MSRRYISLAEAAEYLGVSTTLVRKLIVEGEIKSYRIGSYARRRTLRVDLDEIDEKLMQPTGFHWNDPSAMPRKREGRQVPDRSNAVKTVEESAAVKKIAQRSSRPPKRYCKCGHTDAGHGLKTTIAPATIDPPKIGVCWTCGCKQFVEDAGGRPKRGSK